MRAKPLPPDERRAAIIAAARPLLAEHGPSVSTRDVAEAAGIAEGTLFRVFATKDDLVQAVLADMMDPRDACEAIEQIPADLPLEVRLVAVMEVLTARIREVTGIFLAMRLKPRENADDEQAESARKSHAEHTQMITDAIAGALGADADLLRLPAEQAAHYISSIAFVTGHPMISAPTRLTSETAVQILLHGLLTDSDRPTTAHLRTTPC